MMNHSSIPSLLLFIQRTRSLELVLAIFNLALFSYTFFSSSAATTRSVPFHFSLSSLLSSQASTSQNRNVVDRFVDIFNCLDILQWTIDSTTSASIRAGELE